MPKKFLKVIKYIEDAQVGSQATLRSLSATFTKANKTEREPPAYETHVEERMKGYEVFAHTKKAQAEAVIKEKISLGKK